MLCDLIIDGNFLLIKLVFTLNKNNLLYGELKNALNISVKNYRSMYPFKNTYLVSDSKERSWRKKIHATYKSTRKKSDNIDWEFVFETYKDFKDELKIGKVLEAPEVEGDDWISFLVNNSNKEKRSCIIVSNDHDIKQLIKFSINPLTINIMSNEMYNRNMVFLPENYKMFLSKIESEEEDIFTLNTNKEFLKLISQFEQKYNFKQVDNTLELFTKIVSGDTSDNIPSAWSTVTKSGRKRGIGKTGAISIYKEYLLEFGEPDIDDIDLTENIADIICERKKIPKTEMSEIKDNIDYNLSLISLDLDRMPEYIIKRIEETYKSKI